ncbi:MAG: 5-methyltetrahydropteroyltriglutamate--homocysteine S-methyltransferase [Prevotella sp.]
MEKKKPCGPFRADVVGSFLRPSKLSYMRSFVPKGKLSDGELKIVEDECIRQLVEQQNKAGLKTATDGEYRRSYWHLDFFWGFSGVEHNTLKHGYFFHDEETRNDSCQLTGMVNFNPRHPFLDHFRFLLDITPPDMQPRVDIPAPAQMYAELLRESNALMVRTIYGNRHYDLMDDIANAYRRTLLAFYDLGCRHIKLDDCTWGMLCDRSFWEKMAGTGYDAERLQEEYLYVNNKAIENLPNDLLISTHVCRGNYHSTWATSGDYEPVAETLFAKENVKAFYLEFDDERSGGFRPLRFVPEDKKVVLGLITTKSPLLEDPVVVKRRIQEASQYVPMENLYLSPQCGFASTEEGNQLTEKEQWLKIRLVQQIAEEVWQS